MQSFFERVIAAFNEYHVHYSIVGGYAVALHGVIRGTVDIDAILSHKEDQFVRCENALRSIGLSPRLPVTAKEVFQFRDEYLKKRNLIAWSFINLNAPLEIVDIILTHDLQKLSSINIRFKGQKIKVLSKPDLIKMKKLSGRKQDQEDVKMLEDLP